MGEPQKWAVSEASACWRLAVDASSKGKHLALCRDPLESGCCSGFPSKPSKQGLHHFFGASNDPKKTASSSSPPPPPLPAPPAKPPARVSQAKWKFRHPGMPVSGAMTVWQGLCKVCPDLAALRTRSKGGGGGGEVK